MAPPSAPSNLPRRVGSFGKGWTPGAVSSALGKGRKPRRFPQIPQPSTNAFADSHELYLTHSEIKAKLLRLPGVCYERRRQLTSRADRNRDASANRSFFRRHAAALLGLRSVPAGPGGHCAQPSGGARCLRVDDRPPPPIALPPTSRRPPL